MSNKRKKARSRRGLQVVTLCISTTMVLILLGMVVFFVLSARNLSAHMKENLTVTVMLKDSVSVNDAHLFCRDIYHRPYAHEIDYISKEQAQREQIKELGSDPTEFLGFNPFPATLEIRLKADYANRFVIHTMKLVGASWGFIRRPFLRQAVMVGVIAAILAIGVLGTGVYGLYLTQPGILDIVTWEVLAITGTSVLVFGIVITALCAWLAVNKFLKMKARELYKI